MRKALGYDLAAEQKKTLVYCPVSSRSQLPIHPDLKLQTEAMRQFCLGAGIAVDEWIEEIGGRNLRRYELQWLSKVMAKWLKSPESYTAKTSIQAS